jgi:hypothetical protein
MAATIGGITCTFVRGHAPRTKMRLELWHIPGLSGFGAAAMGNGDSQFQFTGVLYSNEAGVLAWKLAIEALQGTIISVLNDLGITYTYCLVVKVGELRTTPALASGGITQRGEITIEGVVTQ